VLEDLVDLIALVFETIETVRQLHLLRMAEEVILKWVQIGLVMETRNIARLAGMVT
jgi:hypothetical protein